MFGIYVNDVVWGFDTEEEATTEARKCAAKYHKDVVVFRIIGTYKVEPKWVPIEDKQSPRKQL